MTTYDLSGSNYSETDSSNSNAGAAGFPEGMAPSFVNDAARAFIGAAKRAYDWDHAGTWATVGGTGNAITLTYAVAPNAYVQGQKHAFKATAANSGATTVNVNSLGVKNIFKKASAGPAACAGAEIEIGDLVEIEYDGTQFQIMGTAANTAGFSQAARVSVASAATTDIFHAAAPYVLITGTTTITSLGTLDGAWRAVQFAGSLTLTNNASIVLPGGASIQTAAGDTAIFIGDSGLAECISYTRASGQPVADSFSGASTYAHFREQQTNTTGPADTLTGSAFTKRTLNTTIVNNISGVSISASQITLPAGTYFITATSPALQSGVNSARHVARIRDVTTPATLLVGSATGGTVVSSGDPLLSSATVQGRFALAGVKVIELDDYAAAGMVGGAAISSGEAEVYSEVFIWKLS